MDQDPEWVYLSSILDLPKVPTALASLLRTVVADMVKRGIVNPRHRWQALEVLATNWLAQDKDTLSLGTKAAQMATQTALDGHPRRIEVERGDVTVQLVSVILDGGTSD